MSANRPRVSVILPFYNAVQTLERAIQSIFRQEYENYECILVDNNSVDGSREVALSWEAKDKRFRVVREKQQGVTFASNRGCAEAEGEFLARMDADDIALPNRLSAQVSYLDQNPHIGAVAGLVTHVGDPESTGGFRRFVDWSNSLTSPEEIYLRRFIELPIVNPTATWRRSVMEEYGLYRHGDFPEDYEMWLRWLDAGVKVAKVAETVLEWHDSAGRLTRTREIYSDRAFYGIKSKYLAKWLKAFNPFHPRVAVWGASRISRRRAKVLEQEGVEVEVYIDTKRDRQLGKRVVYYEDLPHAGSCFILTYIRQMDNRERIQAFLEGKGYREGLDYLLVS